MDLFRVLGAGAKFDKKRFRQDVEVFHAPRNEVAAPTATEVAANGIAPELDFFAAEEPQEAEKIKEPKRVSKKRKLAHDGAGEEGEKDAAAASAPATYVPFKNEEEASVFRKEHRIRIYGTDVPHPIRSFAELGPRFTLRSYLTRNLVAAGYETPTSIQMQSIPIMLHGRDLMSCAPTGSGKTLAYLLPILHDLKNPAKEGIRAVVICPTRELATQIHRELQILTKSKPFKTVVLTKIASTTNADNPNLSTSFSNADILISTPLRLVHAVQQQGLKLDKVRHLILDEADKLLELGFLEQVDDVLAIVGGDQVRKSLFSATIPSGVEELARTFMKDPIRIVIGQKNAATETINQKLLYVGQEAGKLIAIRQLISTGLKPPVLIFVQSIDRAKELFHELVYDGINVDIIHSDRTKLQRDTVVNNFRMGKTWVLIATELMARGVDFKGVNLVINYDFPQSVASYIHRIGRTGRAGRPGEAVTYFTKEDAPYLKLVVNVMRESGCEVPSWMVDLKPPSKNEKKALRQKAVRREVIKTVSKFDERHARRKKYVILVACHRVAQLLY
ncbi:P-loop containing nucleoside triphosphate hydrolase protein [Fimicolochytrium jonesii]|uniref:P-loop containing nucleoside triphosphate hydrolase protein n=1 Tax=Fimicolochytrium jonesii TaxID=1396493 RepID=UPI0022FDFA3F|nr:P-loop containing nucleoside triphosphate hydrolase protein [Fimicolochytrium jonesii]KAI8823026.1 P-loop containing nucleoside triphosphate hydrolase protein [Fimicolochytrium jonesii]